MKVWNCQVGFRGPSSQIPQKRCPKFGHTTKNIALYLLRVFEGDQEWQAYAELQPVRNSGH